MQKTLIYIDAGTKALVSTSGSYIKYATDYPTIERGQWQVLCVQFVDRTVDAYGTVTLTDHAFEAGSNFLFVADNDFKDDNNLMLKSYMSATPFDETNPQSNRINIEGDWITGETADVTKGQVSIRIYADTVKFAEALGSKQSTSNGLYINIKQYLGGVSSPSSVAWFGFNALNTIKDYGEPEEVPSDGSTVIPIVNSLFQKGVDMQFSANGTEWHETQGGSDIYYRMKFRAINTEWSDAIKMLAGSGSGSGGADYSTEIADLTQRLSVAEASIAALTTRVSDLESEIAGSVNAIAEIIGEGN